MTGWLVLRHPSRVAWSRVRKPATLLTASDSDHPSNTRGSEPICRCHRDHSDRSGFGQPQERWNWQAGRRLLRSRLATVSAIVLVLLALIAIFAPFVAPYDYTAQDYSALTQPPSREHWLGTDDLGRDILSRLIFGARISLAVGLVVQAVILLIGVPAGLIAAHFGGKVDTVIMRTVDALYSIPSLLFVIVIMTFLRATLATASNGFTQALAVARRADRRTDRGVHRHRD